MKIVSKKSPWYNHCCPYTKLWSVKKNSKSNHEKNTENWDYKNFEKLPWISNISPKIKRVIKKRERYYLHVGKKSTRNSLTKKPPKLPPDSQLGLYHLDCLCNEKYIGESKKRVLKQCIVHQQDSISRKWVSPGAENIEKNGMNNSTDCIRKQYAFHDTCAKGKSETKFCEALQIKNLKTINDLIVN